MNHPMAQVEVEELEGMDVERVVNHRERTITFRPKRVRKYREPQSTRRTRERAKRIARQYGIVIETFVSGNSTGRRLDYIAVRPPQGFVGIDPFEGDHFARDWSAALDMIVAYVKVLATPVRTAMISSPFRYAEIGCDNADLEAFVNQVNVYLPRNYSARLSLDWHAKVGEGGYWQVEVRGRDNAGWTLDGYVLPRLASGLIFGREVAK